MVDTLGDGSVCMEDGVLVTLGGDAAGMGVACAGVGVGTLGSRALLVGVVRRAVS